MTDDQAFLLAAKQYIVNYPKNIPVSDLKLAIRDCSHPLFDEVEFQYTYDSIDRDDLLFEINVLAETIKAAYKYGDTGEVEANSMLSDLNLPVTNPRQKMFQDLYKDRPAITKDEAIKLVLHEFVYKYPTDNNGNRIPFTGAELLSILCDDTHLMHKRLELYDEYNSDDQKAAAAAIIEAIAQEMMNAIDYVVQPSLTKSSLLPYSNMATFMETTGLKLPEEPLAVTCDVGDKKANKTEPALPGFNAKPAKKPDSYAKYKFS